MPESTHWGGPNFKCTKNITKNDLIVLCDLLTKHKKYAGVCTFQLDAKQEGGIRYVFNNAGYMKRDWIKMVQLHIWNHVTDTYNGKWYPVDANSMVTWKNSHDLIFRKRTTQGKPTIFGTLLRAYNGAPPFTIEELKIWEDCFAQIGILRDSRRYPVSIPTFDT